MHHRHHHAQRPPSRHRQGAHRRGQPATHVRRHPPGPPRAHHYLAIFDHGTAIALYHTKRLASPGQRIVLYAKDRGCTRPGCDMPGYWCEVHHVEDWATSHRTDIDQLTLACGPHHRLLDKGWTTRQRNNGDTEWIPPPHLDRGQPRTNTYHHPEKLLVDEDDDGP
jgi:hypothetical protein